MRLNVCDLRFLGLRVLERQGVPRSVSECVVNSLVLAEMDGIPSHGFSRLPYYADQVANGLVRRDAVPVVEQPAPSLVCVDAALGFAFPAILKALDAAGLQAESSGVSFFAVRRSHHCGVLGHFAERVAREGRICLIFSNTPAAMAPWNGRRPIFGTNPLAFGCPREGRDPVVVDMSLSGVARGKIVAAAKRNEPIPEGWALDEEGKPTTDPKRALAGTLLPAGGAKGSALALMVEILAASLPGARHGFEATSFYASEGDSPATGQSGLVIDPDALNPDFAVHLEILLSACENEKGVRLPGARRFARRTQSRREGIELPDDLYADLCARSAW